MSPEVNEVRNDIAETREDLAETAQSLADKADVKARAKRSAKDAADQVGGSVRRRPGWWTSVATVVAGAAATIGIMRWRRARRRPASRAARAWSAVKKRFGR